MLDAVNSLVSGATEVPGSHFTSLTNFDEREPSIAQRMADIIIARSKDAQPTCQGDLKMAGFSTGEIGAHFPEASRIANQTVIRQDAVYEPGKPWEQDPAYRADRVQLAASTLAGFMPTDAEAIALLRQGDRFGTRELGDLWPEIIAATASLVGQKIGAAS